MLHLNITLALPELRQKEDFFFTDSHETGIYGTYTSPELTKCGRAAYTALNDGEPAN